MQRIIFIILYFHIFSLPFPVLSRKSSCILYGGLREHTLCMTPPPRAPQGLPNAPPSGSWARPRHSIPLVGSSDGICNVSCARNVIWATFQHISTHFWHGSRPVIIGPHTKCMTSMTSMTSTARVRARSRAPYHKHIRKLDFLIFVNFFRNSEASALFTRPRGAHSRS